MSKEMTHEQAEALVRGACRTSWLPQPKRVSVEPERQRPALGKIKVTLTSEAGAVYPAWGDTVEAAAKAAIAGWFSETEIRHETIRKCVADKVSQAAARFTSTALLDALTKET